MRSALEFSLADSRFALPIERVIEVAPRVWIEPLPGAPPPVLGAVIYRGAAVPAIDLRGRFGLPTRPASLNEQLIIAQGAHRRLALLVDRVAGLLQFDPYALKPPPAPAPHVAGLLVGDDGLIVLQDLDAVLEPDEEGAVARSLAAAGIRA